MEDRADQRREGCPPESQTGALGDEHRGEDDDQQAGAEAAVLEDLLHEVTVSVRHIDRR